LTARHRVGKVTGMKLRIRGNSLRLRLTQGEVARIAEGGAVDDAIAFPSGRLAYSLAVGDVPAMQARFDGASIAVLAPAAEAKAWATSDAVGMEAEQPVADGTLRILVEKDFACARPREDEDDSDAYPHPRPARC
jgi:hypothetical protein